MFCLGNLRGEMSSRKCYVCNSKTTSRWFRISEEITEDVRKCFNVKEIESQGNLCASCRRNLTRWPDKCLQIFHFSQFKRSTLYQDGTSPNSYVISTKQFYPTLFFLTKFSLILNARGKVIMRRFPTVSKSSLQRK